MDPLIATWLVWLVVFLGVPAIVACIILFIEVDDWIHRRRVAQMQKEREGR